MAWSCRTSPNKAIGAYRTQKCILVRFLGPETNLPCVPKRLPKASFVSPQEEELDLDRETIFTNGFETLEYRYGFPIDIGWRLGGSAMPQFHKLENCSVWDNAFFALKGQIQRTMECVLTDGVITPNSPKQSYRSLQNSKMYPILVFRPLGQICHVSLKGF